MICKLLISVLVVIFGYIVFLWICSLFVDTKREYEKHSAFYRSLLNGATTIALKIMRIRIHVEGLELIQQDTKKLLFVCNHRSNFDPIVTWHVLKRWQPAFVSKAGNFRIPVFGRIIRKCCFMEIDRENPRNAMKTIIKASELLKKGEVAVGIYPEGTRSKEGILLPFHNGVFKIAQKAEAPIVVLYIDGTEKIYHRFPWHHTDVYLSVLGVLEGNEIKGMKTDVIGMQVRELMSPE